MKKISEHLGELIVALACVAFLISVTTVYGAPVGDFFLGISNQLGSIESTVLDAFENDSDSATGGSDFGGTGGSGGSYGEVPENVRDFYTYVINADGTGYKLGLKATFKTALVGNTDYVVDGETLWTVGSVLPNPGSIYDNRPVVSMNEMFEDLDGITTLDLSGWDTSNVTDMSNMFTQCYALTELVVSGWDTSNVTDMSMMFHNCIALTTLDLSGWDTSNVTDMSYMFFRCHALTELVVSGWDTSNVTNMSYMFAYYYGDNILTLDLSSWDTSNVTDMSHMFFSASLTTLFARTDADKANFESSSAFLSGCTVIVKSAV